MMALRGDPDAAARAAVAHHSHDHVVQFYEHDSDLVRLAADFLAAAITCDGAAVVLATPEHISALESALIEGGIDVAGARHDGRWLAVDASEALAWFMRDGAPDADAFDRSVGEAVRRAAAGGRQVRAFGEMVSVLWAAGNVAGAMQLERLWNALADSSEFSLLCGYAAELLGHDADPATLTELSSLHTAVFGGAKVGVPAVATGSFVEHVRAFPAAISSPRAARWFVADVLCGWGRVDLLADATLLVTELATNAVVHARSGFTLAVTTDGAGVRIAVRDTSTALPALGEPRGRDGSRNDSGLDDSGGRGIRLVASIARRWGHDVLPGGKSVWAEIPVGRDVRAGDRSPG